MLFRVRGGIPRFNVMLCLALDDWMEARGFRGTVLSLLDGDSDYRAAGRPWERLDFQGCGGQARLAGRTLLQSMRTRPRGLIVGLIGMSPLGWLCRPFLGRGFIVVAHGTEAWNVPKRSRRMAMRRAERVWAVSRKTGDALGSSVGYPASRVRILPNTLDPTFRLEPPETGAVRSETSNPELLSVARLWADEGQKGVDHTIEAVARLRARHPGLRYRIVGKGSDRARLERLVSRLDLTGVVSFEHDLSDEELADRYRRCTAFVLPSGQEGFGIVFLEAMRFSKPCIGGAAGGTPEVVADGETGLLVPFGDVSALERCLDRLLSDPGLAAEMGRAGRERLEREFLFPRFRERLGAHLDEWLGLG